MRPRAGARMAALALAALAPGSVLADWTATGQFRYEDRAYDYNGFTGAVGIAPVRLADVEIVDANATGTKAIIGRGATDLNGIFSIFVRDTKVRNVYARAVTTSTQTANLHVDVRSSTSQQAVFYAAASATAPAHSPIVDHHFGTATIAIGQGGEPFNLFDQMLRGTDYAAHLTGARPSSHLATVWAPTNGITGSWYDIAQSRIILRDSAGYDDTVILHEMGHFITSEYSATSTTGGTHTFAWCDVDLRLAFDEGWGTFWGNSTLRFLGIAGSNIYTRTNGGPGPGNLVRSADLESDIQYLCEGATSEVVVFSFLWDIVDGPLTPDTTPGVDEPHDLIDLEDAEMWEVFTDYIPSAVNRTLEDYWDGWFLPPVQNGMLTEMTFIAEEVGVEYREDIFEDNGSVGAAAPVTPGTPPIRATFFRDADSDGAGEADEDYYAFDAVAPESYIIETLNLLSDANTKLYLIDRDGSTVLAINDDRSAGDESSHLQWAAPATGTYYVRVVHSTDWGVYGSYEFRISPLNPVDDDFDGYILAVDCDDEDPDVNPGAPEACNLRDDDCDTVIDEGFDADLDGFSSCAGDCNDLNPGMHPSASEVPGNGMDDDCDGTTDEATVHGGIPVEKRAQHKPAAGQD